MTGFQEFVALALTECLLPIGSPQEARATAAGEREKTYQAEGPNTSDPVAARQVAKNLGIGSKVRVRTQDRNILFGRIVRLDAEQLYIKIGEGGPVSVSYAQIIELKPKRMKVAAKIAIGVGVAVGILLGVAAAICGSGGCS